MSAPAGTSIVNGRLIDPANGVDAVLDLHILDGKVAALGAAPEGFQPATVIDARDQVVCPGIVDLAARLREPGFEYKATISSETAAAARSGITTLCCPPDTDPVIDTPAVATLIRRRAKQARKARVLSVGALTQGLRGEQLSEMAALQTAGCVALGNAQAPLVNTLVERRALEYAATFGITIFLRPEDKHLRDKGCVHEGVVAARLGLPGIPEAAETVAVARDLALAEHTGATIHFRGLSTATAVRMVRDAQAARLPVSADVSAHQLHLTENDLLDFDAQCHVTPPLRTPTDRDVLRQAVRDGTIAAICSDHQPHDIDAKEAPFPATAPGISALETLLPLALRLVEEGVLDLPTAVERLTYGPARILSLPYGRLEVGRVADICVFDPQAIWRLDRATMASAGRNTPFHGWEFAGQVTHTLFEGRVVYRSAS